MFDEPGKLFVVLLAWLAGGGMGGLAVSPFVSPTLGTITVIAVGAHLGSYILFLIGFALFESFLPNG